MSKGFPFLTLTLTFVVVLLLEATHVFAQTSAPSQESNHPSFTVSAVSPSTPRKNESVRATNHNPPTESRDPSNPANGGRQHMFPATNDNRRLIVDTMDVDLNHDDCIGGDAEMGEFVKRVASALKEFGNADWRAMGVAKRADVNGDGRICWCDFIAIYLKDKVLGLNHEFPFLVVPDDVMFNQLDADGDGKLEGKERDSLQAQFASCMTPRQAQSIVDAMSLMADLDKSITLQEYRAFFSHRYKSNRPKQMSPRHQQQQQQQQPRPQQPQQVGTESQWQEELEHLQQDPASPKRSERLELKRPSDVSLNNRPATPQSQQPQRQPLQQQHQQELVQQTDQEDQLLGVELDLQKELLELQEQQEQQQDELQQLEQLQKQRDLQQKQLQQQQQQQQQQQRRRPQQQKQPPKTPNAKHAADVKNLEKSPAFYQKWYRQQLGKLPGSRYAPRPPALAPSHPAQTANPTVRGSPHVNQYQGQAVRQHDDNKPESVLNQDKTAKSPAGMAETEPQNPKINHRR